MSQRLRLPINHMCITSNYMNPNYRKQWGFNHYGIDAISTGASTAIFAIGNGIIYKCGQDGCTLTGPGSRLGNVIIAIYRDVYCNDGKIRDLTCRMYHIDKILCAKGDSITAGTIIGHYGNTGANTSGPHLHIEFDIDCNYPEYGVGIAGDGNIVRKGSAQTSINPSNIWYRAKNQTIIGPEEGWASNADVSIPLLNVDDELSALQSDIALLRSKLSAIRKLTEYSWK